LDERRRLLASLIRAVLDPHDETYRRIWEENRKLVHYLRQVDVPIPEALRLVARHVLERQARDELERLDALDAIPERVFGIAAEAKTLGVELDLAPVRATMHRAVRRALERVAEAPTAERIGAAVALIQDARALALRYGHWATQNQFYERWGGALRLDAVGRWVFTIEALADPYRSWLADLAKRHAAGQDLTTELAEGLMLIRATAARAGDEDARALTEAARRIERAPAPADAVAAAGGEPLVRLMERHLDHTDATWCEREFEVVADRERARFAAWYEFFPRSSGTFKDAET